MCGSLEAQKLKRQDLQAMWLDLKSRWRQEMKVINIILVFSTLEFEIHGVNNKYTKH